MNKLFELFLFLLLLGGLFFVYDIAQKGEMTKEFAGTVVVPDHTSKTNVMDHTTMMNILQHDNELLEMILNNAQVMAPSKVSSAEREKLPAIFSGLPEELYRTEIASGDKNTLVLFDFERVHKKVNLMQMQI